MYIHRESWREASGFGWWRCKHPASYMPTCWVDDRLEARCTGSRPAALPSTPCCWEAGWGQQQTLDLPAKPGWEGKRMGLILVTKVTTEMPRMNAAWMQSKSAMFFGGADFFPTELITCIKMDGAVTLEAYARDTVYMWCTAHAAWTY